MAITDIKQYTHLTQEDIEQLGRELDAIRTDIEESRGERDARYVRRTIQLQRGLAAGGRIALFASKNKFAWVAGTAMLAVAKIVENMELGHNITHGQWDWMNDPEIHSTEWEWDTPARACSGSARTTLSTTSTPTSSAWTTTSATGSCA
jgi:linoleoyl-CoA desaturase